MVCTQRKVSFKVRMVGALLRRRRHRFPRAADEGGRALDAEAGDLVLEGAGHVVGAVVVAAGETLSRVFFDAAEVMQNILAHRLKPPR